MTDLEKKKLEAEIARVKATRLELEVRITELQEAMDRLSRDVELHVNKEKELQSKLDLSKEK